MTTPGAVTVIERIAEPLPGGRAQLWEYVFEDGQQLPDGTCRRGSPAPAETVCKHEEILTFTTAVTRRRP